MRNFKTLALIFCALFANKFYAVTWTWIGGTSTNWDTKSNWNTTSGNTRPQNTDDVIINSGATNQPTLFGNRTIRNLTINGGTLDLRTNNLRLNGTFTINGGNITNGQAGTSGELRATGNVTLNSATDFTIITSGATVLFRVYANIAFTDGIFWTSSDDLLQIENNATVSGASSNSYAEGPVIKVGNDPFTFPIGKNGFYAPITMTAPSTTTSSFTGEYFPSQNSNTGPFAAGIDHISSVEYWIFNQTSGSSTITLTLSYDIARSGPVNTQSELRVVRWNGTQWANHGNGGTTGTTSFGTVTSSVAITSFSPFTIGSSTTFNPLPVNLISFNAEIVKSIVELKWTVAQENNNDFYTIEKSLDGVNWVKMAQIKGAVNSESVSEYFAQDANPVNGVQFYRLSQTDLKGTTEYFNTISVNVLKTGISVNNIYPNPTSGTFNIDLSGFEFEYASITVTNLQGQVVFESGDLGKSVNVFQLEELIHGVYFIHLNIDGDTQISKIIKN